MAEPRESRSGNDVEQPRRTVSDTAQPQRRSGTAEGGLMHRGRTGLDRSWSDPFSMMSALHREMNRMFENFGFGGSLMHSPFFGRELGTIDGSMWSPQVEVYEKDGRLHVCADLPGLDKKDLHIEVKDDVLTIEGERRSERSEQGFSERSYGRFFRSIPLPEGVDPDSANAKFENGVLDVTLNAPKPNQRRGKRIEIA